MANISAANIAVSNTDTDRPLSDPEGWMQQPQRASSVSG
jgi:hypothetical protein